MSKNNEVAIVKRQVTGATDELELKRARANVLTTTDMNNQDISYGSSVTTADTFDNGMGTTRGECLVAVSKDHDGFNSIVFTKGLTTSGINVLKLYKLIYDVNLDRYNNVECYLNSFSLKEKDNANTRYSITFNPNNIATNLITSFTDVSGSDIVDGLMYDSGYTGLSTFRRNDLTYVNLEIMNESMVTRMVTVPILNLFDPIKGEVIHNTIDDSDQVLLTGL